jgi:hypothetical protein
MSNFPTIGLIPWVLHDATIPGKVLSLEVGRASSSVGPEQAFYIGDGRGKKVRFAPDSANDFFKGLDTITRRLRAGQFTEGSYFEGQIIDFDNDVSLVVDFGIASGKPYFRLGDEEIEIRPDDLDRLNDACREFHPLARGGRRGGGMGKLLAQRYNEGRRRQMLRQQNQPQRRDEFDPGW